MKNRLCFGDIFKILFITLPLSLYSNPVKLDMLDDIFSLDLDSLQNISVVSGSKMNQPLKDVPANMIVFTDKQISKRGFRSVSDMLATLPGVMIHNFSTSGYYNSINIRGATGAHYFKILLDGVEIDQTNGEMISTAMNFSLHGIERAEILYGPASVIYGGDAVSGIVNLITKDYSGGEAFFSIAEDGYTNSNFRYAKQLGQYKLILRGHLHKDQEYKFDERYPEHFLRKDILNSSDSIVQSAEYRSFDYNPSNTKSLNILLKHKNFDIGMNYSYTEDSTMLGQIDKKSYQNLFDKDSNILVSLFGVNGRYHTSFDDMLFTSTLSYDSTEVEKGSYFINKNTDYNRAYKYSKSEHISFEETVQKDFNNHQFIVGLVAEHFSSMPMSFDLPSPKPSSSYTYPGSDIPVNYYKTSWNNFAVFAQDYYTLSEKLKLSLAMRYDYNTIEGDIVNPRAAIIYQPNTKSTHKLIYSEAFLSPSMNEKYKHYGLAFEVNDIAGDINRYKTGYFRVPNETLEAEKSRTLEYTLFTQLDSNLFLNSSLYYTKIDNLIGEKELTNLSMHDVTVLYATQIYNSGHGIIKGFDMSFNYKKSFLKIDTESWINYSYIDGYMKDDIKKEIPFVVPHQINAGMILSKERWSLSPSIKWINHIHSGYTEDGGSKREEIDGYTLFDLFGTYKLSEETTASLRISNLFDKKYYNARNGFSSTYAVPQLGREAMLGIKAKF